MSDRRRVGLVGRKSCPSCGSSATKIIYANAFRSGAVGEFIRRYYRRDPEVFGDAEYQLARCSTCTLLFQATVGDPQLLATLYGDWINDSNLPGEDREYQAIMQHPREFRDGHEILTAASFLGRSPHELTTLDYGMGWGMWARAALDLGCQSYGVEYSDARTRFAARHGVGIVAIDAVPRNRFDFINTEQVMEHVVDLRETAERLAAALKPGGILKISVPSADGVSTSLAKLQAGEPLTDAEWMPIQPLEHVNSFTTEALHRLSDDIGLSIVRPSYRQRYAFLAVSSAIGLGRPRNLAKELMRPFYTYRNPDNLYVWMRRA